MKILWVGLKPSSSLKTALLGSGGFELSIVKSLADVGKKADAELAIFAPSSAGHAGEIKALREKLPHAYLALVVEDKWLKDQDFYHALLKEEAKQEVWVKSNWELTFWFSLQNFTRFHGLQNELEKFRAENRALKKQSSDLTVQSKSLIDQLERDVSLAANIQKSLLPKFYPEIPGVSVAVKYIPAAGVGGDYYDIFEFGDKKRFGILIADSKTHGMAAALLSVLVKVRLEEMKDRFPDAKSFVEFLNKEIQSVNTDKAPLSLFYGILDRTSLSLQYTFAGKMNPILWRDSQNIKLAQSPHPYLGDVNHFDFQQHSLSLKPGDLLTLYTDGLDAVLSANGNDSETTLNKILRGRGETPDPLEVQNELMALVNAYQSRKALPDDLTLIHFAIGERTLYLAPKVESV